MMQKALAVAVVLSTFIIGVALVYHGQQLAKVSRRLQAMEQRTTDLDKRMERFSEELPGLVEQAGNNAGREAVHGMVDEVVRMPLQWLKPRSAPVSHDTSTQTLSSAQSSNAPPAGPSAPWIVFDIRDPVIHFEILPRLKEIPAIPWPPMDFKNPPATHSNHVSDRVVRVDPLSGAE